MSHTNDSPSSAARGRSRRLRLGRRPPRPTRSRARSPRTAAARASGTRSATRPGAIDNGDTGDVACDHYHRVARGPRPDGRARASRRTASRWPGRGSCPTAGTVEPGRARLLRPARRRAARARHPAADDALPLGPAAGLDVGDAGGWLSRDLPDRFVDYALALGKELGDRVPAIDHAQRALVLGVPRLRHRASTPRAGRTTALAFRAAHHLNLAHGRAVTALRSVLPPDVDLSVTLNLHQVQAASDRPEDLAAAEHADLIANRIFLDPMFGGGYSDELRATTEGLTDWSFVQPGDEAEIGVAAGLGGRELLQPDAGPRRSPVSPPFPGTDRAFGVEIPGPRTVMGWPIVPSSFTDLLLRVSATSGCRSRSPRTGSATATCVEGGAVHDDDRIDYLHDHLARRPGGTPTRCRRTRLLRVDPARQLRVGLGLRQALRPGARGLRRPAPDAQGLRTLVRRGDRAQRAVSRPVAGRSRRPLTSRAGGRSCWSRPVSNRPARPRWKCGCSATVTSTSYHRGSVSASRTFLRVCLRIAHRLSRP